MKILGGLIILGYGLVCLFILVAVIYLIVRRVEERDNETFEKRDN